MSPTNLVYNVVAIPSGVYRYFKEGRMLWPLTWMVSVGTLPGLIAGGFIRLNYFLDPKPFKAFVGCVLLYMGLRMFWDWRKARQGKGGKAAGALPAGEWRVRVSEFNWRRLRFSFQDQDYSCSSPGCSYCPWRWAWWAGYTGIGGGAIIAPPFLVAIYRLPVHAVAGAALSATCLTSPWEAWSSSSSSRPFTPAWARRWLRTGFWAHSSAWAGWPACTWEPRTQRLVPGVYLKLMLGVILLVVALRYVIGYLFG